MTEVELLHRLKEQASSARYMYATPEYTHLVDDALMQVEFYAGKLIELREEE